MAYCPTCKNSFDGDVTECPTDKVPLVDELPYQTVESESGTWVEIASAGTPDEAQLLQGFLQAEGIDCQIESLKFNMEPINFGTMGEIRIFVRAEDEAAAVALLQKREDEYEQLDEDGEVVVTDDGPAEIDDGAQTEAESE
jgi:Putative prokaryotic signal transducing protein